MVAAIGLPDKSWLLSVACSVLAGRGIVNILVWFMTVYTPVFDAPVKQLLQDVAFGSKSEHVQRCA